MSFFIGVIRVALYNQCAKTMCRELVEKPHKYCEKHREDTTEREYNKNRYKYSKEYLAFYNSSIWRKKRNKIKRRDNYQCQRCKCNGIITVGTVVDHIIPTKVNWDKRLDDDNLQLLCQSCHNIKTREDEKKYRI